MMASSTIRKAIGAVKDQTSISLAKVAGNVAPDIEVLVVKATTHDNEAPHGKYAREILNLMSHSRVHVNACVFAVSKRLSKTSDWIVALKALMLVHKLLNKGDPVFRQEMLFASRRGARVLHMTDFRDDVQSNSWEYSAFVRAYALYLDQKLHLVPYGRKLSVGDDEKKRHENEDGYGGMERKARSYENLSDSQFLFKDIAPEKVLERLSQLLRLLDRFLASRPMGAAKNTRVVLVAVKLLVKDGFRLYADVSDALKYLGDYFSELDYACSVKAFDAYYNASKMIDDLNDLFNCFKHVGLVRSSEFPEVQKIDDKLLGSLEGILREKANRAKESFSIKNDKEVVSMNEIKALPPPQNHELAEDLVNLRNDDEKGNKLALALFSSPGTNVEWVDFAADEEVKSKKADCEMVLVKSASNLSMSDDGTVKKQHRKTSEMSGGSGSRDPFAASLVVPPPTYVQIADMERKQRVVVEEQRLWERYARSGMQGQLALAKISAHCDGGSVSYGMPQHYYRSSYST